LVTTEKIGKNLIKKALSLVLLAGLTVAGLAACDTGDYDRDCKRKSSQSLVAPDAAVDARGGGGGGGKGGGGGGGAKGGGSSSKSGSSGTPFIPFFGGGSSSGDKCR
jgi:hypothetical protein